VKGQTRPALWVRKIGLCLKPNHINTTHSASHKARTFPSFRSCLLS
jgi:hypothetical protein